MTADEFWEVYNREFVHSMPLGYFMINRPVGGVCGACVRGLFREASGDWCIETLFNRSVTPARVVFKSEEEAVERFYASVVYLCEKGNSSLFRQIDKSMLNTADKMTYICEGT